MRTTETPGRRPPEISRVVRFVTAAVVLCLALGTLFTTVGCSGGAGKSSGSKEETPQVGANMAGPTQKVVISKQAIAAMPPAWVLTSPESAVRSYLDWTSYAYRITESSAATPTMSAEQEVHVDSYVQYNLQKSRILDQSLKSITFGKPTVTSTSTLLPAREQWDYRYVSIEEVGKTIGGPYKATYDTTYAVIKNDRGDWVVDTVAVKAIGDVK